MLLNYKFILTTMVIKFYMPPEKLLKIKYQIKVIEAIINRSLAVFVVYHAESDKNTFTYGIV